MAWHNRLKQPKAFKMMPASWQPIRCMSDDKKKTRNRTILD